MDSWSDVAAHPAGGFIRATGRSGGMDVFHNDVRIWSQDVMGDWPRFTHLKVSAAGQIAVTAKGEGGQGWVITPDGVRDDGPTYGNDPIVPHWQGEVLRIYRCAPGDGTPLMIDGAPTGVFMWAVEGIRDILPDGKVVTAQNTAKAVFNGRNFGQYTERDGWVVGQSGNSVACLHVASDHFFTAHRGTTNEGVHFALQTNGDLAVVALTEGGPFARVFSPPYPPNEPLIPPDEPHIPPVDPPVDPPEQPPTEVRMRLTPEQFQSLKAARAAVGKDVLTPAEGGAYLNRWCWDHRHDANRPGLERDDSDPKAIMPDGTGIWAGLRIIVDGKHYGGDVSGAASVGRFEPVDADFLEAQETGPHGRVEPIDPGGVVQPPDQPPDEPPTQEPDPSVLARLAALEVALAEQKLLNEGTAAAQKDTAERLAAIIDKPVTLPDDVVRVSTHKVRTGPVRVFGVNAGTYDGEIVRK